MTILLIIALNGTASAGVPDSILYVDGTGNGNYTTGNYTTIQDAVNNATPGNIIIVYPGTYTENVNITVENLSIRSYSGNPEDTIVKHVGSGHNFKISANNVTIGGFNITGADSTGIYMSRFSGANITGNRFSGVGCGVQMENSSSCNLINNTVNDSAEHGFYLSSSSTSCILANNTISYTGYEGILLEDAVNCTLTDNAVSRTDSEGICVEHSNGCILTNNTVTDADCGVSLYYSDRCVLRNNTANSGIYGLCLWDIKNCKLTDNIMSGNWYNFDLDFNTYSFDLNNSTGNIIDTSNLVDGKPIYYLERELNPSIGSDAGVVYCINCGDTEIKDFVLKNNTYGFFLYNTSAKIQNNTISNTGYGISVLSSHDVELSDNRLEHSNTGVELYESMNITLTNNTIRNSRFGSFMANSYNCTLTGNSIQSSTGDYNLFASENSGFVKGGENSFTRENTRINSNSVHVSRPFELLESSNNYTPGNNILTNSIVSYSDAYGADFGICGVSIYSSSYCTLTNNTVSYTYQGIYLDSSSHCTLNGNAVSNTYDDGIWFYYSRNCSLAGNNVSGTHNGICLNSSSNCNITGNKVSDANDDGIDLDSSSNCNIAGNTVSNANDDGIDLDSSNNCNTAGNMVSNTDDTGVCLESSEGCRLTNNTFSNTYLGIYLTGSDGCILRNNTASSGNYGIKLENIENCTLTGNIMSENRYNFDVYSSDFHNGTGNVIDTSNLVDGKAVYYLEGELNPLIGRDAGVIYCINCGKAEIKDFVLKNNSRAVFLYNTSSEIQNNTVNNTIYGVQVLFSQDVRLSGNTFENSMCPLVLEKAINATLSDNIIRGSMLGIQNSVSENCTFMNNSIEGSALFGVATFGSKNCTFADNSVGNSFFGIITSLSENCTFTGNFVQNSINNYGLFSPKTNLFRYGENTLISENAFINSNLVQVPYQYGFGIYSMDSRNLSFEDNIVDQAGLGIYLAECQNSRLVNNSIRNIGYVGVYTGYSSGIELLDNTIQNVTGDYMLTGAENFQLASSSLIDSSLIDSSLVSKSRSSGYGIYSDGSCDIRLEGNNIKNCYPVWGIYLSEAVNATVKCNTLQNCQGGIITVLSENLSINDCSVTNCTSGGILVINPLEGIVNGYTISDCNVQKSDIGIMVTGEGTLSGNNLSGNSYGLILYDANNSLVYGNTMAQNSVAGLAFDLNQSDITSHIGLVRSMEIPASGNNIIYNNYFNNVNNILINSKSNNIWNTSKTAGKNIVEGPYLGGNYWATPQGTGFSENSVDADKDGIADSSYEIANGAYDYLPLTGIPTSTTTHRSSTNYVPSSGSSGVTGIDSAQKRVAAGTESSFNFNNPVSDIMGLSFTSQQYSGNVIVRIEVLGDGNPGAGSSGENPGLQGEVYQQMNILIGNERFESGNNINGAAINFRVAKKWVEENKIDVSTIAINRFHDEEWNALVTERTYEDEEYYYFRAETPGFSRYAITGDKIGAGNTQGTEIIVPAEEEENAATDDERTKDKKAPGFEGTFAVLGILVSMFFAKRKA